MDELATFCYLLIGGPFDGRKVLIRGTRATECYIYQYEPYQQHCSAYAVYGRMDSSPWPPELYYWGSRSASPHDAHGKVWSVA